MTSPLEHKRAPFAYERIYEEIRGAILRGTYRPGERLPSTRATAQLRGVARVTAVEAYDRLIAEGYLETARGSGTFVSRSLPEELLRAQPLAPRAPEAEALLPLSEYARRVTIVPRGSHAKRGVISFTDWTAREEDFPLKQWARLITRHARSLGSGHMADAPEIAGLPRLRELIAQYLREARGVRCTAAEVAVVTGSQQALDLSARLLVNPGDTIAMEEPGYHGARGVFRAHGANVVPVPVDRDGILTSRLAALRGVRAVFVTPSHQFPTGAALSLERRLELLRWARANHAAIIEDDYDSEYRYGGRPLPALQGLEAGAPVIYAGTFSNALFPALRLGYLVAPPNLAELFANAKFLIDRHTALFQQAVVADFIESGQFHRHLRRTRTLYAERHATLARALDAELAGRVERFGAPAGLQMMIRVRSPYSDRELLARCRSEGVEPIPAANYFAVPPPPGYLLLGFASLGVRSIREGVKRLARAIR